MNAIFHMGHHAINDCFGISSGTATLHLDVKHNHDYLASRSAYSSDNSSIELFSHTPPVLVKFGFLSTRHVRIVANKSKVGLSISNSE